MATEKQILANRRSRRAPGRARWRARRAPRMNARRHGLASLLEGVMPETSMDVEAPAERLSEIESERLRLYQAIEQGLKQGDHQQIAPLLLRLAALERYTQR